MERNVFIVAVGEVAFDLDFGEPEAQALGGGVGVAGAQPHGGAGVVFGVVLPQPAARLLGISGGLPDRKLMPRGGPFRSGKIQVRPGSRQGLLASIAGPAAPWTLRGTGGRK